MIKMLDKNRDSILFVFLFFILGQILDSFMLMPTLDFMLPSTSFVSGNIIYKILEFTMYIILNMYIFKQKVYWELTITKKTIIGLFTASVLTIILTIYNPGRAFDGVILMLITAIVEEYINRGLLTGKLTNVILKDKNSYISVFGVLILSGILFGMYHLSNIHSQSLSITLSQMIQTAGIGVLLTAFYMRTGSLIFPIIVHFLWDYNISIQRGVSSTSTKNPYFFVSIIMCLTFIIVAVLMTKKIDKLRLIGKVRIND